MVGALDAWLGQTRVLSTALPPMAWLTPPVHRDTTTSGLHRLGTAGQEENEEEEDNYYDCGRADCKRSFAHEHNTMGAALSSGEPGGYP